MVKRLITGPTQAEEHQEEITVLCHVHTQQAQQALEQTFERSYSLLLLSSTSQESVSFHLSLFY